MNQSGGRQKSRAFTGVRVVAKFYLQLRPWLAVSFAVHEAH